MMVSSGARFSTADFNKLSTFIYNEYGIKLPPAKKVLLESRLQKRLEVLGLPSFNAYCDFLFSAKGQKEEMVQMIDLVTTNKTDFFREPSHFDFLKTHVLPEFTKNSPGHTLKIWSAGCSSGEEVYTLAMVLSEYAESHSLNNFTIYGTDISTRVLKKATEAIYNEDRVEIIPLQIKRKYLLKNTANQTVRIAQKLRSKVKFERLNFMDDQYDMPADFDIIFCRNVLIYFDKITQEKVINKLCLKLRKNGFFFLGHSESITTMQVPLNGLKPTVFQKI